jgi:ABC-type transporter Mla MlaB component
MSSKAQNRDSFSLGQELASPNRTRLLLSGRLDVTVTELFLTWTADICGGQLGHVELDLTGLTHVDRTGARALAVACQCLQRHSLCVDVIGDCSRTGIRLDVLSGEPWLISQERNGERS